MTEQSKRIGEETKRMAEDAKRMGQEYQRATEGGLEAVMKSWDELGKGWTAIAAEMTDYSKRALDDATRAFEQVMGAKSVGDAVELQAQYVKKAYDTHVAELNKLGQMYVSLMGNAYKPVEQSGRRT